MSEYKPLPEFKTFDLPYDRHGNPLVGFRGSGVEEAGASEESPWTHRSGKPGVVWSKVMSDEKPIPNVIDPGEICYGPITP